MIRSGEGAVAIVTAPSVLTVRQDRSMLSVAVIRPFGTKCSPRRRLPRQAHSLKVDSAALVGLWRKVSGGDVTPES